jgi:hypothetical protein
MEDSRVAVLVLCQDEESGVAQGRIEVKRLAYLRS